MKTQEELNAIRTSVGKLTAEDTELTREYLQTAAKTVQELSEDELLAVCGGTYSCMVETLTTYMLKIGLDVTPAFVEDMASRGGCLLRDWAKSKLPQNERGAAYVIPCF